MIRYLLRRAWNAGAAVQDALTRWAAANIVTPTTGSDYDHTDQELDQQYRRIPRQR